MLPISPEIPYLVEEARADLCRRTGNEPDGQPLPSTARMAQRAIGAQLTKLATKNGHGPDHLYALEFQGYRHQYVMFGHTRNLENRLAAHQLAATPHGFAMLQGWVSPGLTNAQPYDYATGPVLIRDLAGDSDELTEFVKGPVALQLPEQFLPLLIKLESGFPALMPLGSPMDGASQVSYKSP